MFLAFNFTASKLILELPGNSASALKITKKLKNDQMNWKKKPQQSRISYYTSEALGDRNFLWGSPELQNLIPFPLTLSVWLIPIMETILGAENTADDCDRVQNNPFFFL